MPTASGNRGRAVRLQAAIQRQRQLATVDRDPAQHQRRLAAHGHIAGKADTGSCKGGERGIGCPRDAAPNAGGKVPRPGAKIHRQLEIGIRQAQISQHQIARGDRAGEAILPGAGIAIQREGRTKPRRGDHQIIGMHPIPGKNDRSLGAAFDKARIQRGITGDNTGGDKIERESPTLPGANDAPLLHRVFEAETAADKALRGKPVRDTQLTERPVDGGGEKRTFEAQIRTEQRRITHGGSQLERTERIARQIDIAAGADRGAFSPRHEPAGEDRAGQCPFALQLHGFASGPRGQAADETGGAHHTGHRIAPGTIANRQIGHSARRPGDQHLAAPIGIAARTRDAGGDAFLCPQQGGEEPAPGRVVIQRQIEPVRLWLAIELAGQAILPAQAPIGEQDRTALADIGLGDKIDAALFAQHPLGHGKPFKFEPIHPDIEIRQDRSVRIARI